MIGLCHYIDKLRDEARHSFLDRLARRHGDAMVAELFRLREEMG